MTFAISARRDTFRTVLEQRIKELEGQLVTANANITELTKTNASLTASLSSSELHLKRSRRNARQDGAAMRDQITTLQSRRG
jgi:predicted  nucleic acid-binding Zn-ribbon protein